MPDLGACVPCVHVLSVADPRSFIEFREFSEFKLRSEQTYLSLLVFVLSSFIAAWICKGVRSQEINWNSHGFLELSWFSIIPGHGWQQTASMQQPKQRDISGRISGNARRPSTGYCFASGHLRCVVESHVWGGVGMLHAD